MNNKPHILVVCGRNKKRSRTAEHIFKNDARINIRSVGLSAKSDRQLKDRDIEWADLILVMEQGYANRIIDQYRHLNLPAIEILHIDDEYEFLDPELIDLLTDRINEAIMVFFENE